MKKIIIAVLLLVTISSYAYNYLAPAGSITTVADTKGTVVPDAVLATFNSMFPNSGNVRWSILTGSYHDNTQYFAQFRLDGVKRTARFKPDGTYIGGS
jgi:hypothetical protein